MSKEFRVVDCRTNMIDAAEIIVSADTPEQAARLAIGEELVRGSRQSRSLRARVYLKSAAGLTMVRLYSKPVEDHSQIAPSAIDRWGH